jgi:FtsH-binding integral membrane protein
MLATFAGLAVVAAVGWFAAEPAVRFVMPQYVDAVPAMRWALLLPLASCFLPLEAVFNVVRRQDMYLVALGCGIAAYAVALVVRQPNADLTAFPQAMLVGRVVFLIASYLLIVRLQRSDAVREALP